jgi:hypothetical protein
LRNPERFDPLEIRRYTVIHVWYEYPGQRGEDKYFIVLRQTREAKGDSCWCIKATCRVHRYEADPELMKGVVFCDEDTLLFFTEKTVIDPESLIQIWHSHLQKESQRDHYRIAGRMPEDFHVKLVTAVKQSFTLEPKTKIKILELIGG